ncbi:hypothetical protein AAFX91_21735 [Bradyrhizobium sp. 31Argb]|uniref:hypothetical protein n=1 Tax=Bradyrhizobium sp. 31Argb TaxID=3141247 RepID=UPI00374A0E6D
MSDRVVTRFAVARMQGVQPRLFAGRFEGRGEQELMTPVTTGNPDRARLYEDEVVAQTVAKIFNTLHRIDASGNEVAWVAMRVPEALT